MNDRDFFRWLYFDRPSPIPLNEAWEMINSPETPSNKLYQVLRALGDQLDIAKAIARHVNCPENELAKFSIYLPEDAQQNPNYEKYKNSRNFQYTVNRHGPRYLSSKVEPYIVQYYLEQGTPAQLRELAEQRLPKQVLQILATNKNTHVRKAVALNSKVTQDVLQQLAGDHTKTVRKAVAENKKTDTETIAQLARDQDKEVKATALKHPNCPEDAIHQEELAKYQQPSLQEKDLAALSGEEIRQLLCDRNTPAETLEKLLNNEEPTIRYACGLHSNINSQIAETLLNDPVNWVRKSLAANKHTPVAILEQLYGSRDDSETGLALASNSALPEALQLQWLDTAKPRIRRLLADHTLYESVWDKILETKAKNEKWFNYLALARNPKTTPGKISRVRDALCGIRAAARHPNASKKMLGLYATYIPEDLAKNPSVALRLLENPNAVSPKEMAEWGIAEKCASYPLLANYYIHSTEPKYQRASARSAELNIFLAQTVVFSDDIHVRKNLAERNDLPRFMFEVLAHDDKKGVRESIAKNRSTPKELITMLVEDKEPSVRTAAAQHSKAKDLRVTPSIKHKGSKSDRIKMAKQAKAAAILEQLAEDKAAEVRYEVVANSCIQADLLKKFVDDPEEKVRSVVASKLDDVDLLARLSKDPSDDVRNRVVWNQHTPEAILGALATDEYARVRQGVAHRSNNIDVLLSLTDDPDLLVREGVASRGAQYPEAVRRFLEKSDHDVIKYIAQNTKKKQILIQIIDEYSDIAAQGILGNTLVYKYQDIQLKYALHDDARFREHVAKIVWHLPDPHEKLMEKLVQDPQWKVRKAVAEQKINRKLQGQLVKDEHVEVRASLAFNAALDSTVIQQLAEDPDEFVRAALATHEKLPEDLMLRLSEDPSPKVRHALTDRWNLPEEIWKKFLDDPDERVQRVAQWHFE